MRIDDLTLEFFGHFKNYKLEFPRSEHDLHLIVGENEAGKSTFRRAIGEWLFGIHPQSPLAIGFDKSQMRISGQISAGSGDDLQSLRFARKKGNKDTLRDAGDSVLPPAALNALLAGSLDRDYFEQMFCLDHALLRQGGKALISASGGDRWAQLLFQSSSGLIGIDGLMKRLDEAASAQYQSRAKGRVFNEARGRYDEAKKLAKENEIRADKLRDIEADHVRARLEVDRIRAEHLAILQEVAQLNRVQAVSPFFDALARLAQQKEALGSVVSLPANASERLIQAQTAIRTAQEDASAARDVIAAKQDELIAIELNPVLSAASPEIEGLVPLIEQYRGARQDLPGVQTQAQRYRQDILHSAARLEWILDTPEAVEARLPVVHVRESVRQLSENLKTALDKVQRQLESVSDVELQIRQTEESLQDLPNLGSGDDLKQAIEGLKSAIAGQPKDSIEHRQKQVSVALSQLPHFRGEMEALRGLSLPSQLQALAVDTDVSHAEQAFRNAVDSLKTAVTRLRQTERELAGLRERANAPDLAALEVARSQRDSLWLAIRTAEQPLDSAASAFETSMQTADQIVDERFDQAERVHRIETAKGNVRDATSDQKLREAEAEQAAEALKGAKERRCDLYAPVGLPPMTSADLDGFRAGRDSVLRYQDSLDQHQASALMAEVAILEAAERLRELLEPTPAADLSVARLLQIAETKHTKITRDIGAMEVASKGLSALKLKKASAATSLNVTEDAVKELRDQWMPLAARAGLSPGLDPLLASACVEAMGKIDTSLEAYQALPGRLQSMRLTIETFEARVAAIATRPLGGIGCVGAVQKDPVAGTGRGHPGVVAPKDSGRVAVRAGISVSGN